MISSWATPSFIDGRSHAFHAGYSAVIYLCLYAGAKLLINVIHSGGGHKNVQKNSLVAYVVRACLSVTVFYAKSLKLQFIGSRA